jgi:hypothetical protein
MQTAPSWEGASNLTKDSRRRYSVKGAHVEAGLVSHLSQSGPSKFSVKPITGANLSAVAEVRLPRGSFVSKQVGEGASSAASARSGN